jgi:hypothetical protein
MYRNTEEELPGRADCPTMVWIASQHSSQSQSACQRSGVPCGASAAVFVSDILVFLPFDLQT